MTKQMCDVITNGRFVPGNQQPQPSTGLKSHGNKQLHGLGNQGQLMPIYCNNDEL